MCKWIIDRFDPDSSTLAINNVETVVAPKHVEYLLGFQDVGFDILEKELPGQWDEEFISFATKTSADLSTDVRRLEHTDKLFKQAFTMFFIAKFSPPYKRSRESVLHLIAHPHNVGPWNWAKFILENTLAAVAGFNAADRKTELGGYPLLLMIMQYTEERKAVITKKVTMGHDTKIEFLFVLVKGRCEGLRNSLN
ncbi:uncharacterized protein [Spinacia oleracea]|uniref:DUF1985 domain-containing protein n=1 Tax=Spinacia oleracea TaxID=3562 RepID=A0ABM3QG47_SPIOL|nr:uncharacterized protein LOC130459171 [Spinacia oleracea]